MRLILSISTAMTTLEYRLTLMGLTITQAQLKELIFSVFETLSPMLSDDRVNYRDIDLVLRCLLGPLNPAELEWLGRYLVNYYRKNLIKTNTYDIVNYEIRGDTLVVDTRPKEYYHANYTGR